LDVDHVELSVRLGADQAGEDPAVPGGDHLRSIPRRDLARRVQDRLDQEIELVLAADVGEVRPDVTTLPARPMTSRAPGVLGFEEDGSTAARVARVLPGESGQGLDAGSGYRRRLRGRRHLVRLGSRRVQARGPSDAPEEMSPERRPAIALPGVPERR